MNKVKLKAYIGFAVKAREILYGVDNLKSNKLKLVIYSDSLAKSSKEKCKNIALNNGAKTIEISQSDMVEVLNKNNVMALGITNKSLAEAIVNIM